MIEKIQNYYESSAIGKAVVLGCLIIPFGAFAFFVFSKKNNANQDKKVIDESHLVIYEKDTSFTKNRDGYYKENMSRQKIEPSDDFLDFSNDVRKVRENLTNGTPTDSIYKDEQDPRFAEMERKIQEMTKQNPTASNNSNTYSRSGNGTARSNNNKTNSYYKKPEKKELSYKEKLELAKKKRMESISDYGYSKSEYTVSFDVIIFEDQWKLPGQRLQMVLPKETKINGKTFRKGTSVYATVNIQESRVFLNINNINGTPMKLEAFDPDDHERGLYSQRAGELWKEYQSQTTQNTQSAVANEVSRKLNVPVVGSAMTDMVSYFSKKRRRDEEKLLFLNDHRIILKTTKK